MDNKRNYSCFFLFLITSGGVFLLNQFTPWVSDDYEYMYTIDRNNPNVFTNNKITGLSDILQSQYEHYFVYNGRTLVHILAQFFSSQPNKLLFNAFNSLMFSMLILLIAKYVSQIYNNPKISIKNYFLVLILIWFFLPSPGETILYQTGSLNYLWTTTILICFLLVHNNLLTQRISPKPIYLPLLFFLGVISGWGHEGTSMGVAGALFLYYILHHKQLTMPIAILIVGFFIGTAFVSFAPGIFIRIEKQHIIAKSCTEYFALIRSSIIKIFIHLQLKAFLLMVAFNIFVFFYKRKHFFTIIKKNIVLYFAIIIWVSFHLVTGFVARSRGAIGLEVFSILIIILLINELWHDLFIHKYPKRVLILLSCVIISLFIYDYFSTLLQCKKNYLAVEMVKKEFRNSQDGIIRSPFDYPVKARSRFIFWPYSHDRNGKDTRGAMFRFSKYYNKIIDNRLGKLLILNKDIYDGIYSSNRLINSINRIKEGENWYTTANCDFYISDISEIGYKTDERINVKTTVVKMRTFPNSIIAKLLRKDSISSFIENVPVINTPTGKYILVEKLNKSFNYPLILRNIEILD